jgi:hypothetical protein
MSATKPTRPPAPSDSSDPVTLREAREVVRPARVSPSTRPRRPASTAFADAVDYLDVAWDAALKEITTAGVPPIVTAFRVYGAAWRDAVRASRDSGDRQTAGNRPDIGGPLDPLNHKRHPKRLKAALARVLTSAGIDLTDTATKRGARQRGRR